MSAESAEAMRLANGGIRVLLVDDESSILSVLAMLLKRRGFVVDTARDAQSAREQARQQRYDVALMDVRLRDTMGTELAAELERDCGLEGRVALMTGGSRPTRYPCLQKPFDYDDMANLLRRLAGQGEAAPPSGTVSTLACCGSVGCGCRSR